MQTLRKKDEHEGPVDFLKRLKSESGQTLAEYGLLLTLVMLAVVLALTLLGNRNADLISTASNAF